MRNVRPGFLAAAALAAAAFAAGQAQADERYLKTVCLWNDTDKTIGYELQWDSQWLRPVTGTIPAGSWYSHSLVLANASDPGVAVKLRFKPEGVQDFSAWTALEPLVTTSQDCNALRGQSLHYEFKKGTEFTGGYGLRGPTNDP